MTAFEFQFGTELAGEEFGYDGGVGVSVAFPHFFGKVVGEGAAGDWDRGSRSLGE